MEVKWWCYTNSYIESKKQYCPWLDKVRFWDWVRFAVPYERALPVLQEIFCFVPRAFCADVPATSPSVSKKLQHGPDDKKLLFRVKLKTLFGENDEQFLTFT